MAKRPKCETSKSSLSASLPLIEAPMYIQFETKKGRYPSNNSTHSNGPKSCEVNQHLTTSKSIRSSNPAMIAKNYTSPFYKRQPIKPPIHLTKHRHQLWDRSTNTTNAGPTFQSRSGAPSKSSMQQFSLVSVPHSTRELRLDPVSKFGAPNNQSVRQENKPLSKIPVSHKSYLLTLRHATL